MDGVISTEIEEDLVFTKYTSKLQKTACSINLLSAHFKVEKKIHSEKICTASGRTNVGKQAEREPLVKQEIKSLKHPSEIGSKCRDGKMFL